MRGFEVAWTPELWQSCVLEADTADSEAMGSGNGNPEYRESRPDAPACVANRIHGKMNTGFEKQIKNAPHSTSVEKKKTKSNERQAANEKECVVKVDAELLKICDGILALVERRAKK